MGCLQTSPVLVISLIELWGILCGWFWCVVFKQGAFKNATLRHLPGAVSVTFSCNLILSCNTTACGTLLFTAYGDLVSAIKSNGNSNYYDYACDLPGVLCSAARFSAIPPLLHSGYFLPCLQDYFARISLL